MAEVRVSPEFPEGSGDIRLISTDGTVFYVHRLILQLSSSFFNTMFQIGSEGAPHRNNTPLRMEADAITLTSLLQYIYPTQRRPRVTDLDQLIAVLRAAARYEMTGVTENLRSVLTEPGLDEGSVIQPLYIRNPLKALAIADAFGFLPEARLALRECLNGDLTEHLRSATNTDIPARLLVAIHDLRQHRLDLLRSKLKVWAPALEANCVYCSQKLSGQRCKIEMALDRNPSFQTLSNLLAEGPFTCGAGRHNITIPSQGEQAQWEREWRALDSAIPDVPTSLNTGETPNVQQGRRVRRGV